MFPTKKRVGMYIHLPFCRRRCFYCHFVTYPNQAGLIEPYVSAVITELRLRARDNYLIDTIYLGGGSPSLMPPDAVGRILTAVRRHYVTVTNPEVTLELNPEDACGESLKQLRALGVNRLSIGVQSFCPEDLKYLGRTHGAEDSMRALRAALNADFKNLSVDFIIGLPTQTRDSLEHNFQVLSEYKIPHVSCYLLEGVTDSGVDDAQDADHYFHSRSVLLAGGYHHYEVSNYCLEGWRCEHNLKYWLNQEYLGIGVSASGFIKNNDYKNNTSLDSYCRILSQNRLPAEDQQLSRPSIRGLMMGLRLLDGIPLSEFVGHEDTTRLLLDEGIFVRSGNSLAVHPEKLLVLNEILTRFL